MSTVAERSLRVIIAKDGTCAHLSATDTSRDLITREHIIAALKESGLPITEAVLGRVQALDQAVRSGQLPREPVLMAEGREPRDGASAVFELSGQLAGDAPADSSPDEQANSRSDFYRSHILTVSEGTVIGKLTPEVAACPGVDVFGKAIMPSPALRPFKLGSNVRLGPNGTDVVAAAAGKVHLTNREVGVVSVVDIAGDVDFNTGNVDAPTDVLINGTVRDSFHVISKASVTVRGAIEAAEVRAETDIQVNGGIASRHQGLIAAGGEVFTKFCNEACIEAQGDVTITREAMNSQIRTQGRLIIATGKLLGGRAYAREGVEVFQLGNEANIKTEVAVGIDPAVLVENARIDEQIKKKQEAIAKIRQSIQPLMAQLKRLTPQQRERATELMFQADEMEHEIQQQEAVKAEALKRTTAEQKEVALTVTRIAFAGTSIIFGDKIATLHKERKGPFRVVRRLHERCEEVLLIDRISGSISVLGARDYTPTAPGPDGH